MTKGLYIIGGRQKRTETRSTEEWHRFGQGVVTELNLETFINKEIFSYISPPEAVPDVEPSVVFKSGSLGASNQLHLCTQTEAFTFDPATQTESGYVSLPSFNDVHHVIETNRGTRLLAVTGLDMVQEVSSDGSIVNQWNVLGDRPFDDRFSPDVDYRKVATTKPHRAHPNYVFEYGDEVWSTRFEQKDAICLTNPERRIDIGIERPHDGVVVGDLVYFTTVDSHIVIADLVTCKVVEVIDLYAIAETDDALGWSRGLHIDGSEATVGFSTLRVTKIRQNVRWVKERFGRMEKGRVMPTHVASFDLEQRKLNWRHTLEDPQVDVIFSVLANGS